MNKETEIVSDLIAEISWATKCAKEQADMLGYTDYQKEYHIRKTIAEALARVGYRKADEVRKETAKEILFYLKATITDGLLKNHEILNALIKKYDIEVDK